MKLEEALRKTIRQFGVSVLQEKRMMFILSDFRAFEEFPAVKQVFQSIVSDGSGKELCRLFLDDDSSGCLAFAGSLKKSLAEDRHFKQELAGYAVDSITFALGLQTAVREPSDHSFDPMDEGKPEGRGGAATDKKTVSGSRAESSPANARVHEQPRTEEANPEVCSPGSQASAISAAAHTDAGAGQDKSSLGMKLLAVLILLAGVFVLVSPGSIGVQSWDSASTGKKGGQSVKTADQISGQQADRDDGKNGGRYEYDQGWKYELGLGVSQDYTEALKWYRKSADLGNKSARQRIKTVESLISYEQKGSSQSSSGTGQAQSDAGGEGEIEALALGNRYFNEKNYAEAVKYYRKAAELGNADAQSTLGCLYDHAEGVRRNYAEAAKWYRKAAEQGNNVAQNNLGTLYYNGQGVKRNYSEALKWFRKAADHGNAAAYGWLGDMYYNGQGVKKNYGESAKWYRKAAEQGDAYAQNELGVLYYNGQGVKRNYGEALRWFRKAADQGNTDVYGWLGIMNFNGQGTSRNYGEALKWFRKDAERGSADAQNYIGWMYQNGLGVMRDNAEAVNWYRKAASGGSASGQINLGWMYETGTGVRQDNAEALLWYRKAAGQGNADAKERVRALSGSMDVAQSAENSSRQGSYASRHVPEYDRAEMYFYGRGVTQDYAEAMRLYREAAAEGDDRAYYSLGWMYQNGLGVSQSLSEAASWYRKAAAHGNTDANSRLVSLDQTPVSYTPASSSYVASSGSQTLRSSSYDGPSDPDGQFALGERFFYGRGVPQDYGEAFSWYGKAAGSGNADAMYSLGWMYQNGLGVSQSLSEAVRWYRMSAANGNTDAVSRLRSLDSW